MKLVKNFAEKFYNFYFSWGYFYFSASFMFCKKIENKFSNEFNNRFLNGYIAQV